jgi:hypothetical protein
MLHLIFARKERSFCMNYMTRKEAMSN